MRLAHFTLIAKRLYGTSPGSPGYEDKLRRAIDAADPGAVPGGSTKSPGLPAREGWAGVLTGPNQDRRVLKSGVFFRAE